MSPLLRVVTAGAAAVAVAGTAAMAAVLSVTSAVASAGGAQAITGGFIPPVAMDAYLRAEDLLPQLRAGCAVRWSVMAGIARVETDHGRYGGATTLPDGTVVPPIIGIALDGSPGVAAIRDSDAGHLDGDTIWDRAVGPFQFIPSSWRVFGQDANSDGIADPNNLVDAAVAAAVHLCTSSPGDFTDRRRLAAALLAYNHSDEYVDAVLRWIDLYDSLAAGTSAAGTYALPVVAAYLTEANVRTPHHDYPAWDLPLPVGTPVYAIHSGRVRTTTERTSRCGLGVVIDGADGFTYSYCHASSVAVDAGQEISAGQLIALSGNTGNSSGPHLHVGVEDPMGRKRCPQDLLIAILNGATVTPITSRTEGCSA